MARAGILYSHVAQAAAQLIGAGKNPTVDSVREALGGTGSKSTIAPFLKRWKAEQQDTMAAVDSGLPASLLQAVTGLYEHMQAELTRKLDQAKQQHAEELHAAGEREQQFNDELQAALKTQANLSENLAQTRRALAQLQEAHHTQSLSLATAQAENAGFQQRLADRASEVTTLDHQLTQTRAQFEHYQEATAARRAEERQAYEQRIARLEQDLASANRQTAVQQTTIGQQEMRIANFTAECDRQDQALHATQEELTAVRSARDRLTDQVRDLMTAKDDLVARLTAALRDLMTAKDGLVARLTAAQQQLSDMRAALAAQEQASSMLTDQVRRAEERADHLAQEKHTWLQDRGALEQRLLLAEQKLAALTGSATTA